MDDLVPMGFLKRIKDLVEQPCGSPQFHRALAVHDIREGYSGEKLHDQIEIAPLGFTEVIQ